MSAMGCLGEGNGLIKMAGLKRPSSPPVPGGTAMAPRIVMNGSGVLPGD